MNIDQYTPDLTLLEQSPTRPSPQNVPNSPMKKSGPNFANHASYTSFSTACNSSLQSISNLDSLTMADASVQSLPTVVHHHAHGGNHHLYESSGTSWLGDSIRSAPVLSTQTSNSYNTIDGSSRYDTLSPLDQLQNSISSLTERRPPYVITEGDYDPDDDSLDESFNDSLASLGIDDLALTHTNTTVAATAANITPYASPHSRSNNMDESQDRGDCTNMEIVRILRTQVESLQHNIRSLQHAHSLEASRSSIRQHQQSLCSLPAVQSSGEGSYSQEEENDSMDESMNQEHCDGAVGYGTLDMTNCQRQPCVGQAFQAIRTLKESRKVLQRQVQLGEPLQDTASSEHVLLNELEYSVQECFAQHTQSLTELEEERQAHTAVLDQQAQRLADLERQLQAIRV